MLFTQQFNENASSSTNFFQNLTLKAKFELFHNDCFTFKWLNFCFVLWPFLRNSLIVYNHVLSLELHIIGGAEEQ